MPKMICSKDQVQICPEKNGAYLFQYAGDGQIVEVWPCDVWKCPDCGTEIVAGFALHAILEHWQEGFEEKVAKIEANPASYIVRSYSLADPQRKTLPVGYLGRALG